MLFILINIQFQWQKLFKQTCILSYQGTDDDGFAKPKLTSSVLGLQELARKRRQEKEEAEDRKKKMRKKRHDSSSSSNSDDDDDDGDGERSHKQDKHYRF